jgi:hypothetical protein
MRRSGRSLRPLVDFVIRTWAYNANDSQEFCRCPLQMSHGLNPRINSAYRNIPGKLITHCYELTEPVDVEWVDFVGRTFSWKGFSRNQ